MQLRVGAALVAVMISAAVAAKDEGFRYREGVCRNVNGERGLNPSFLGPCADLRAVTLSRLDLTGMDFSGSDFSGADLQRSRFNGSTLAGVNFERANLSGAELFDVTIDGVRFAGATLRNVKFGTSTVANVDFSGASFDGSDLSFFECRGCRFDGAEFRGVNFDSAELAGLSFAGASFASASLANADFRGANFRGARLRRAHFVGTRLANADLGATDLRAARLASAGVDGALFGGARFDRTTELPFGREDALARGLVPEAAVKVAVWLPDQSRDWSARRAGIAALGDYVFTTVSSAAEIRRALGENSHFYLPFPLEVDDDTLEDVAADLVDFVFGGGAFVSTGTPAAVQTMRLVGRFAELDGETLNCRPGDANHFLNQGLTGAIIDETSIGYPADVSRLAGAKSAIGAPEKSLAFSKRRGRGEVTSIGIETALADANEDGVVEDTTIPALNILLSNALSHAPGDEP